MASRFSSAATNCRRPTRMNSTTTTWSGSKPSTRRERRIGRVVSLMNYGAGDVLEIAPVGGWRNPAFAVHQRRRAAHRFRRRADRHRTACAKSRATSLKANGAVAKGAGRGYTTCGARFMRGAVVGIPGPACSFGDALHDDEFRDGFDRPWGPLGNEAGLLVSGDRIVGDGRRRNDAVAVHRPDESRRRNDRGSGSRSTLTSANFSRASGWSRCGRHDRCSSSNGLSRRLMN